MPGVDHVEFRPYIESDLPVLVELNTYGLLAAGIEPQDDIYSADSLLTMADVYERTMGGLMLVGLLGQSIVAMGAFRRIDSVSCEIQRMRVYPEHQGIGIGKRLLQILEKEAVFQGYKSATLITGEHQHPAVDIYLANGYRIVERELILGISSVCMEKDLPLLT